MPMGMNIAAPGQVGATAQPFLRLISNAEIENQRAADQVQHLPLITSLAAEIRREWEVNKRAKREIEEQILKDYRQCNAEYEPALVAEINEQGGSLLFANLTGIKRYALQAWLEDILFPPDDRPWEMEATPIADLPPDVEQQVSQAVMAEVQQAFMAAGAMPAPEDVAARTDEIREYVRGELQQRAEAIADKMSTQIEDDLVEGEWEPAIKDALYDFTATVCGIVYGPVYKRRARLTWEEMPQGWQPVESEEVVQTFARMSPLDAYPSPDASAVDDGSFIHHMRLRPMAIEEMIGVPGFDESSIRAALNDHQEGGLSHWLAIDQARHDFEQKPDYWTATPGTIDVLSYWGYKSGKQLMEWGHTDLLDPNKQYHINAWLIGQWVVGVQMLQPGHKRPYNVASLEEIPGSFWGHGLAWRVRWPQDMCNAAGRALSNNMGLASGPQIVYNDTSRIPATEKVSKIFPWKIHQFLPDALSQTHRPPIEFFIVPSVAQELLAVFQHFANLADEISGVPAYAYGNAQTGGAGETASGLSMLMSHASRGVKKAVMSIDKGLVRRSVQATYINNMLYNPDRSIKGDLNAIARGATSLLAKEQQQVRRNEFLQTTSNPIDLQIMGLTGRAALLRESARALDIPVDDVIPNEESIQGMANNAQIQAAVMQLMQNLAAALGLPAETLMQLAQQPPQAGAPGALPAPQNGQNMQNMQNQSGPAAIDPSGHLAAGQETRLFS